MKEGQTTDNNSRSSQLSVSNQPSLIKIVQIRVKSSPAQARKESLWKSITGEKIENLSFLFFNQELGYNQKNRFPVEQLTLFWLGDNFKTQASERKHFNLTHTTHFWFLLFYVRPGYSGITFKL